MHRNERNYAEIRCLFIPSHPTHYSHILGVGGRGGEFRSCMDGTGEFMSGMDGANEFRFT
jgi:hypothetical protein